ncbi:HlyD family secretion protein [Undibacterium sp. GrIS 1.8]|uniref:efflux RND transporter periplasmic adaptor subunit n=1 Tax=unclassified Undibacterium TaxID=2630295 RepID=UPI0033930988
MLDKSVFLKYKWKIVAGLIVASLFFAFLTIWWRGPQVFVVSVVRRDFVQSVVASGHVETPHRVDIGAQITGTVVRVPVIEGQTVKAGDVLIELDTAELLANERQARSASVQAQTRVRQLREVQAPVAEQALRQAQVSLDNSKATLKRNQDLFQQGFIGAAALDDVRKAAELADAQQRTMQKQLETTRPSGSDFALAEANLIGANANADAASARVKYARIITPVGGILISRAVEVGDVVQAGKVLMTLSPDGRAQLVVQIDEKNLRLLVLNQTAIASADAYPKLLFPAALVYINPSINVQTGAVEVKLDVSNPPQVLRQDMTVSVDIEVARRPHVLLVPVSALTESDKDPPSVLRVEQYHAIRRAVSTGLRSGGLVEVLSGVDEGDLVLASPGTIKSGARVRVIASDTSKAKVETNLLGTVMSSPASNSAASLPANSANKPVAQ